MKILLDTHVFLWFLEGNHKLSLPARKAIEERSNAVFFSAVSYWEICIKISLGKLRLAGNWQTTLKEQLAENSITWLSIKAEHMEEIIELPWHHRDPFDRLLIAQAVIESCTLCTTDRAFTSYPVPTMH